MKKISDVILEKAETPVANSSETSKCDFKITDIVEVRFGNLLKKGKVMNIYHSPYIISYLIDFGKNSDNMWVSQSKIVNENA